MNNVTTSLDISPCRWGNESLLEHLFSSLIDLTLEEANSLIVFPFLPSLKKIAIYVANNLLDVKALSHVKNVYLSFCSNLKEISCLGNVHELWLDSFNSEINIDDLANVYELTLTNISFIKTDSLVNINSNSNQIVTLTYFYGFGDYPRFVNATHVTLHCFESTHSIDFTLFKNATFIDLTNFELIFDDVNFLERCKELKNLKTLKFRDVPNLRSVFPCFSLLPAINSLELSEVSNCDDLFDLSSLGRIPYLNISDWKYLHTLKGLGTGNKCVCLTDIPNVKNMLPLISVPKVQLGQHDLSVQCLIQLTNVQHLELSYCNLSDLTPLRHGKVTTLVLYEFGHLTCLDGAENIPNVFIESCFSLTNISCLLNGKNRKFCLWDKIEQLDFSFLLEEGEYLLEENYRFGDHFYAYVLLRKKDNSSEV
eukprot:gene13488-14836_t